MLIGICLCAYFSYHTIFGRYSYPQYITLRPVAESKAGELDSLRAKTTLMERKVTMMRPATLSPDLLEEQIRYILGYNKSDEIVILSR